MTDDGNVLKCNSCGYEREMDPTRGAIVACKNCGSYDVSPKE